MGDKNAGHAGVNKHFYRAAYMSDKSVEKIRRIFSCTHAVPPKSECKMGEKNSKTSISFLKEERL